MNTSIEYYYNYITVLFCFFPFILAYIVNKKRSIASNNLYSRILLLFLCITAIGFIGARDFNIGTDTMGYVYKFNRTQYTSSFEFSKDIGFDLYVYICTLFFNDARSFLIITAILFVISLNWAYKNIFKQEILLPIFLFMSFFLFWNLGVNIMRSGLALSLFLLAISYNYKKNKIFNSIFCIIAIGFHFSLVLSVIFWILAKYIKREKIVLLIWVICLILAYMHVQLLSNLEFWGGIDMVANRVSRYIDSNNSEYNMGFRFDFIFFGFIFIIYALYFIKKYNLKEDFFYFRLFICYTLLNAFGLLTLDFPYSDRFMALSWVLIPTIISYPLIKLKKVSNRYLIYLVSILVILFTSIYITT